MKKIDINTLKNEKTEVETLDVQISESLTLNVRQRLSMEEKVSLITDIVDACVSQDSLYMNPLKVKVVAALRVISASTQIEIPEDIDVYEAYDILNAAGILEKVLHHTDYQEVLNWSYESADALIAYYNSFNFIVKDLLTSLNSEEALTHLQEFLASAQIDPDLKQVAELFSGEITN